MYQHKRCTNDTVISRAIKKYGWENFKVEILESGIKTSDIKEKEYSYIVKYRSNKNGIGYNQNSVWKGTVGGERTRSFIKKETGLEFGEYLNRLESLSDKIYSYAHIGRILKISQEQVRSHYKKYIEPTKEKCNDDLKKVNVSNIKEQTGLEFDVYLDKLKKIQVRELTIKELAEQLDMSYITVKGHFRVYVAEKHYTGMELEKKTGFEYREWRNRLIELCKLGWSDERISEEIGMSSRYIRWHRRDWINLPRIVNRNRFRLPNINHIEKKTGLDHITFCEKIIEMYNSGFNLKSISEEFNVSASTIKTHYRYYTGKPYLIKIKCNKKIS